MARELRFVDGVDLGTVADADVNGEVFAYRAAHRPSCHSDTGDALIRSAERCGDWVAYSPSFQQCRYVALVTRGRIFALGIGQRSVLYRVPDHFLRTALASGAALAAEIGPNWVRFELFRADWPAPDLAFWTLHAYAAAREHTQ
jgi:hypothetical protein